MTETVPLLPAIPAKAAASSGAVRGPRVEPAEGMEDFSSLLSGMKSASPDEPGEDAGRDTEEVPEAAAPPPAEKTPVAAVLALLGMPLTQPAVRSAPQTPQLSAAPAPENEALPPAPDVPPQDVLVQPVQTRTPGTGGKHDVPEHPGKPQAEFAPKLKSDAREQASPNVPEAQAAVNTRLAEASQIGPVPAAAPAQQILSRLAEPPAASTPVSRALPAETRALQQGGEVKLLRMKLRPEELGDVEVTLRRSGAELKVHITVTREAAAEALRRDLSVLEDRLGPILATGGAQPVTIAVQPPESAAPGQNRMDANSSGAGANPQGAERRTPPGKDDIPSAFRETDQNETDDRTLRAAAGLVV